VRTTHASILPWATPRRNLRRWRRQCDRGDELGLELQHIETVKSVVNEEPLLAPRPRRPHILGVVSLVFLLLDLYSFVLFVTIVLSWLQLSPDNPVVRLLSRLTEPVLAPIRERLPRTGGFDFSAMIVLLGIQLLKRLLGGA
jgi:YggT family protein